MAQKPQGTGQDQPGDLTRQHQQQSDPKGRSESEIERTQRDILGPDDAAGGDQPR